MIFILGAGSGIGSGLMKSLASNGPIGFSRRGEVYEEFSKGTNHKFDFTLEKDWEHFQKVFISSNLGSEPIVVYFLHGDGLFGPIEKISISDFERHFKLNVTSIFRFTKTIWEELQIRPGSSLIFAGSTASKIGFQHSSPYCASKHAISGMAKALREEGKNFGLKVTISYLGAIATDIWNGREGFDQNDMVAVEDACDFLAKLAFLPESLFLEEVSILPRKGIL